MKTTKRSWIIRIAFVLVLVLVAVLMLRIGRGHTVYFDNRALDKDGQSVAAPYKITVYVNGEQISKLYDKERCMVTNIGDSLELTVEVMQQKGGSDAVRQCQGQIQKAPVDEAAVLDRHNADFNAPADERIQQQIEQKVHWSIGNFHFRYLPFRFDMILSSVGAIDKSRCDFFKGRRYLQI